MSKILVSGLLNVETNVKINSFPVEYCPIEYPFFGVDTDVSGVGYNVSMALNTLSDEVVLCSYLSNDTVADTIKTALKNHNISSKQIIIELSKTPTSVVLYDESGKRKVYCDLKDIQEKVYPKDKLKNEISSCDSLVLCNINFNDELIKSAKLFNKTVFSDVHIVNSVCDDYNRRFMENSDVLFMSDEGVTNNREQFMYDVYNAFHNEIIVMGCGSSGALMFVEKTQKLYMVDSVFTRNVKNTCGAGDALFSSFVHEYTKSKDEMTAIKKAVTFASYKIGESGGAKGFLNDEKLNEIVSKLDFNITQKN